MPLWEKRLALSSRSFLTLALVIFPVVSVLSAQAADSIAHPIQTACGVRLDPVGFLLERRETLELSDEQVASVSEIGEGLAEENRPFGQQWWALVGRDDVQEERRQILSALRANYRDALAELEIALGAAKWEGAFRIAPGETDPRVRCLCRSILAILGG